MTVTRESREIDKLGAMIYLKRNLDTEADG